MNNSKVIKIISIVATIGGVALSVLADWADDKILEERIDKRVEEKLAALSDEEDEEL